MIPTFVLLALAGGALRVALNYAVRRKLGVAIGKNSIAEVGPRPKTKPAPQRVWLGFSRAALPQTFSPRHIFSAKPSRSSDFGSPVLALQGPLPARLECHRHGCGLPTFPRRPRCQR